MVLRKLFEESSALGALRKTTLHKRTFRHFGLQLEPELCLTEILV